MPTLEQSQVKVNQVWLDLDERNSKTRGAKGQPLKRPEHRTVIIRKLPTLSAPGVMEVLTAPKCKWTEGDRKEFTYDKLARHYALVG